MKRAAWAQPTATAEVHRRAGGRRRWNSVRQFRAKVRRCEIVRIIVEEEYDLFAWGLQARLAQRLGVSVATISRDLRALLPLARACPTCGSLVAPDRAWWADREGSRRAPR